MIIIGERLNTSRKAVRAAVTARDADAIAAETRRQLDAGAHVIDVNAGGDPENETADLLWMIAGALGAAPASLCLDSSAPSTLRAALDEILKLRPDAPNRPGGVPWVMINSISGEDERYRGVLPLLKEYNAAAVALCLDDEGMPDNREKRAAAGLKLLERLDADGVPPGRVWLDPLVVPVGVNPAAGADLLGAIRDIRARAPEARFVCGVSNVSFGLPDRALLNRTFLAMAIEAGLDAVIADPLNDELMRTIHAAEALTGRDEFCAEYIQDYRRRTAR